MKIKNPTPAFYDTIIIIVIGITSFIIASIFSLHKFFDRLLRDIRWDGISGEELPILFAILTLCLLVFSIRRWREIRYEVKRRIILEEDLKKHKDRLEDLVIERTRKVIELHKQVEFILAATKTGLDIIDSGYNMVYIDKGWQKVYGDPDGKKCYEYFMGRDRVCPNCGVTKALATKKTVITEEIMARENNRPVQITTIPYQNEKGEWLVAEVNVDITERKKLDEELKKHHDHLEDLIKERTKELVDSEERFRIIFSESIDGLVLADIDTKQFLMVNKSICAMLGYSEEELKRLRVNDIHPEDKVLYAMEQFDLMAKGEFRLSASLPMKRKDGSIFYADVTSSLVTFSGKRHIMGSFRDATERTRAEEILKASEENYRAIFESVNDAVIIRDIDTYRIVDANNKACEMFCYPKAEMITLEPKVMDADHEEHTSEKFKQLLIKAAKGEAQLFEWLVKDKFGREFWVEVNVRRSIVGGRYRLLSVARDITERKTLLENRDNFVNMVSHELRTPLGAIKESIALISEGKIGSIAEKQKEVIDVAKRNVDRLKRLIDQVLDLQKIDAGRMDLRLEDNSINEMIGEVERTMISLVGKEGLRLTMNLSEALPLVKCDRDKIIEVLINLINNAVKFTQKGGITITSSCGNNFIQISVADTGTGIKKEDMCRLFQRFTKLERKTGGTGLGLSISKEIVEMHRGKLWAESEFGKGTTFHIILPIKERRV